MEWFPYFGFPSFGIDMEVVRELVVSPHRDSDLLGDVFLEEGEVNYVSSEHPPNHVVATVTNRHHQLPVVNGKVSLGVTRFVPADDPSS